MAWCGVWSVEGVSSAFVWGAQGGTIEGLSLAKNDKKQLKIKQSRQSRVYLGFIKKKTGTMRFGPMAGLVGCGFDLILECTCFRPQTDQVHPFLAAALLLL